jgi:hypothetical protein
MPAILWRTERLLANVTGRRVATLALVVPMPILAGFAQFGFFALALAAVRVAVHDRATRRRAALATAGSVAIGLALAAPQILPTAELLPHTQRASITTYEFVSSYSMPPENLLLLAAPAAFGDERSVPYWGRWYLWEACPFVGIATLALAALAVARGGRQRWLWTGVAVASLLLALGRYTPALRVVWTIVPGADLFRAPGRMLAVWTLAAAALAATGFDRLWSDDGAGRTERWIAGGIGAIAVALFVAFLATGDPRGGRSDSWQASMRRAAEGPESRLEARFASSPEFCDETYARTRGALAWAAACAGLAAAALAALRGRRAAVALGALAAVELLVFGWRYVAGEATADLSWPRELADRLRTHPDQPCRIASAHPSGVTDAGRAQMAGLDHVGGYDSLLLRRYTELAKVVHVLPADRLMVSASPSRPHRVLDMLGARLWFVRPGARTPPDWRELASFDGGRVVENPSTLPRAFVAAEARVVPADADRLAAMAGGGIDFARVVVLEEAAAGGPATAGGTARIASRRAGVYEIDATGDGGWLVLVEAWFPGWRATVDGAPAEIHRANHLVQAVRLPAGAHRVRFDYRSRFLPAGFVLAGLALAAVVALHLRSRPTTV